MISIVMVAYEVAAYVSKAIESVLNQDMDDFELILVATKGGRDNCYDICAEYAAKDSRIKLVTIPKAKGVADARNQGLKEVTGDYLGFVDGDDFIEADMYSSMLRNMNENHADIAVCGRFYEYENTTLKDEAGEVKLYTADEALEVVLSNQGFFLHCWDKLYSKKIFEGLSFRTDMYVEDRIVVNRLIGKADKIVYDPTPKYHFRERKASLSKLKGAATENIKANMFLQDYILGNHPAIANQCARFMLYEYITGIQNELVSEKPDRDNIKLYQEKIREIQVNGNPCIGKSIKLKKILALNFTGLLKIYTKSRQEKTSDEYKRFL